MGKTPTQLPYVSSLPARGIAAVFAVLLRVAKASWHWEIVGQDIMRDALDRQERLLVAFWHGKYISLFPLLEGFDACILTSRSFRGEVIAALSRRFGYHCIFLVGQHGRELEGTIDTLLRTHRCLAVAVDGPLGPYHRARKGLLQLASHLQLLVLPASVAVQRKVILHKRWDKLEIPLPGSRILLGIGEPLRLPAGLQRGELAEWVERLQKHIEKTDQEIEELLP